MDEQFISEEIHPVTRTINTARMALGEPGLPEEFLWRGTTVRIQKVLRQWRETGPCRHGSAEQYLRKYWYELTTTSGTVMKIYFLKPAKGNLNDAGWRLFSLKEG